MEVSKEEKPQSVFIACPTHDHRMDARTAVALFQNSSQKHQTIIAIHNSSLLAFNCNHLWCLALNARLKYGIKWFAMLHSDVIPEPFWLDKLIEIAEANDADLLSVVIPIKSPDGLTSTALSVPNGKPEVWKRFTQTEILDKEFPTTFSVRDVVNGDQLCRLLVNTGCMVCRIDQPWSDELFFTINDRIDREFNKYKASVDPEDWGFSRMVAEKGGKVMATKAIQVTHVGNSGYNSHSVWGKAVDELANY